MLICFHFRHMYLYDGLQCKELYYNLGLDPVARATGMSAETVACTRKLSVWARDAG